MRGSVALAISFFNRERDGLGMPLPHGAIRFFEPDRNSVLRYAGAASVQDTPKDQKISVTLAAVFDLTTESRVVSRQKRDRHTVRKTVEVVVRNEKAKPVDVRLVQDISGRWKMAQETHLHSRLNAYQAQWTVPVPAGGATTLRYTVDLKI